MAESETKAVYASFDTQGQAEAAIDELWHEGFRREQIGMAAPGRPATEAETPGGKLEEKAAQGAVVGATAGGAIGTLAGALVSTLIPGIGPVLAGGLLAGVGLGAATGAAAGTYLGPFIALGLSHDESRHLDSQLSTGRAIVIVKAPDRPELALDILRRHGGIPAGMAS
jgi:hypothetical protein